MSGRSRKRPERNFDWRGWLIGALTDLGIGIILILISRLIE